MTCGAEFVEVSAGAAATSNCATATGSCSAGCDTPVCTAVSSGGCKFTRVTRTRDETPLEWSVKRSLALTVPRGALCT